MLQLLRCEWWHVVIMLLSCGEGVWSLGLEPRSERYDSREWVCRASKWGISCFVLPHLRQCTALFAVAEGWLLIDIG